MTKSEIAKKELEIMDWMKAHGYDRKAWKEVAPIILSYLLSNRLV